MKQLLAILILMFGISSYGESLTSDQWNHLNSGDKVKLVDGWYSTSYDNVSNISLSGEREISQAMASDQNIKDAIELAESYMQENCDFEVDLQGIYDVNEDPYIQWINLLVVDNQIWGIKLGFIQDGYEEDQVDVQWQIHGILEIKDNRVTPIEVDDSMNWSGY